MDPEEPMGPMGPIGPWANGPLGLESGRPGPAGRQDRQAGWAGERDRQDWRAAIRIRAMRVTARFWVASRRGVLILCVCVPDLAQCAPTILHCRER